MARTTEERKLANAQCARESRKRKNEQLTSLQIEVEAYKRRLCAVERENLALRRSIHSSTGGSVDTAGTNGTVTVVQPIQPVPIRAQVTRPSRKLQTSTEEDNAGLRELLTAQVDLADMETELENALAQAPNPSEGTQLTAEEASLAAMFGPHSNTYSSATGAQSVATACSPASVAQHAPFDVNIPSLCLHTAKNTAGEQTWHQVLETELKSLRQPGLDTTSTNSLPEATPVWPLISRIPSQRPKATHVSANACRQHTYQHTTWLAPQQSAQVAALLGLPSVPSRATVMVGLPAIAIPTTAPTAHLNILDDELH